MKKGDSVLFRPGDRNENHCTHQNGKPQRIAGESDGNRAGHHQSERRVPFAREIEEAEHFRRADHARYDEADPEHEPCKKR